MLAIKRSQESTTSINVLPCRIQHNGPTKVTKRHWSPSTESDGSKAAYFRGRKLRGKEIKLPAGYSGVVVKATDRMLPKQFLPIDKDDSDIEEEQESEPVKILESVSNFKDITIWGHDQLPTTEDLFVKGVEEWIAFSHTIHDSTEPKEIRKE